MRIIIIGNCGSGKSTLALKIANITNYPLLQLDSLWHKTDYSDDAKRYFENEQINFLRQQDCIIEGNYNRTIPFRVTQANLIIWLKVNKVKAVYRIIKRSIQYRLDNASRPEMPKQFSEHFDHDYWAFLKLVWTYDEQNTKQLLQKYKSDQSKIVILKSKAEIKEFLTWIGRIVK